MFVKVRSHLTPGTLLGTIALFAALGGGYATAFSGSGTLQKGAIDLNQGATFQTVRSLTGIGRIDAQCENDDDDSLSISFVNTSAKDLRVSVISEEDISGNEAFGVATVPSGGGDVGIAGVDPSNHLTLRLHISPADQSKAPQAEIVVTADNVESDCGNGYVSVLALNTQQ